MKSYDGRAENAAKVVKFLIMDNSQGPFPVTTQPGYTGAHTTPALMRIGSSS